jgi:hypothetical protein
VAEREIARGRRPEGRLRVLPHTRTGSGIPGVADRHVSVEGFQTRLGEHLGDQAHVLVDDDVRTIAYCDSRRFLSAMLQCIQAEVSELGDFLSRSPYPENPARILGSLLPWKNLVGQPTIAARHARQTTGSLNSRPLPVTTTRTASPGFIPEPPVTRTATEGPESNLTLVRLS